MDESHRSALHKLSARRVATESKVGRHSDGGGLYLVVSPSGSRKWLFLFRRDGKQREMGLGAAAGAGSVSLADARTRAAECRAVLAQGGDPIELRRERKTQAPPRRVPTFGEFADRFIEAHRSSWRSEKHIYQWRTTISTYAAPLRSKPVDEVNREDVLAVLQPIWTEKNETASRLRGRIELVLDAAKAEGLRQGENPAAWKGNLKHSLPKRQKLQRGHHPAMAYEKVPAFVRTLRTREATAARALEFLILTAARSGEVLGARWSEIDLERGIWTLPAERMKAGREHRVPLSTRVMEILQEMTALREGDLVFPNRGGRPLSNMAMEMLLRRMKVGNVTVHGFRSSFRDWAAEETPFAREIAEAALAHVVGDMTERAYRRGDALEKRRQLMQAWADSLVQSSSSRSMDAA
jgi:integrase